MNKFLSSLVNHLTTRKDVIVTKVTVVTECWSPTYGVSPSTEDVELINFDMLLSEIDNFRESFK